MRLVALLLLLALPAAQTGDLARAEAAYRAGDYAVAKGAWESALARGPDGRIEYNLGNCEFRLGDPARALWRYERALRQLGPREEVVFNRGLALRRLGRAESQAEGLFAAAAARLRAFEAGDWLLLALPLELLGLVALGWGLRRRTVLPAILAALLLAASLVAGVQAMRVPPDRVLGVVILDDATRLRAEPRRDLPAVLTLSAGVRARFLEGSDHWVRVRAGDRDGWIERQYAGLY